MLVTLLRSEIRMNLRQTFSWATPLLFFVMVVCLFPLGLGSDPIALHQSAAAIIWVTALLAILLSLGNIFQSDKEEGFLDLLLLSPHSLTLIVLAKAFSHWLIYCLPLILISPILGFLLHLSPYEVGVLIITLLLGTPVLTLLGAIGAALVIGVRHQGLLLSILIMPFYIPILIFGTGTMLAASTHLVINGYIAVMGALLLMTLAFAPLLTGIALKIGANQS